MKQPCIDAVNQAAGRTLSRTEIEAIESGIARELRRMARDPDSLRMSREDRLIEAARRAQEAFLNEKDLKARREALSIVKHAQIENVLQSFGDDQISGLRRLLAFHADAKGGSVTSVESWTQAIEAESFSRILGTLEATNPKFFGLFESNEGVKALVRELFGEDSGVPEAKAGAREFKVLADDLLERFNRAGGKIGKLEDWAMPSHHSQMLVATAGRDAWVSKTLPLLKRERYQNDDGSLMTDTQMMEMLDGVWETISSGGLNKINPGQRIGRGMEANAHSESRVLHFQGADAYMAYLEDFGEASLYEVITGHIRGMAQSIALVEVLGPNPDHTFRLFRDEAERAAVMADPTRMGKTAKEMVAVENLFNAVSGKTLPVADERLARGFDSLRKWLVASRLGSVPISSLPDEATMRLTAHVNNLDQMLMFRAQLATLNPANQAEKRLAQRAGLGLQTVISSLNRFGDESMRNTVASKLATFQMRVSGNNAITEARRRAFGTTMMSSIGSLTREVETPGQLDPMDWRILRAKGITEADWAVWRLAELEDWGMPAADTMLTPEAIRRIPDEALASLTSEGMTPEQLRAQAATRLLAVVLEETSMAIIEPGARERAALYANLQRGTWKGELTRSVFLFKTTPIAMVLRHWERGMSGPDARSRAGYLAAMMVTTTVLGMAALQVDELLRGRDPVNMNPFEGEAGARNWVRALLKGGSLGIYGDFLMSEQTQHGQSPTAALLGPVVGVGEELLGLTQGNLVQMLQGKDTHAGAEVLKFVRGMTPLANNWYTKAATDHLIFNQLQEMVSPGYLNRVRLRAQREFGQSYYWEPQDALPSRAPDLAAAFGE
jgi:hypothetical protein